MKRIIPLLLACCTLTFGCDAQQLVDSVTGEIPGCDRPGPAANHLSAPTPGHRTRPTADTDRFGATPRTAPPRPHGGRFASPN